MTKKTVLSILISVLEPRLRKRVYVSRSGLIAGLKRRGGFGFVPGKALTPEHIFLRSLDYRGKTVYDIGGYIGLVTMFFACEVGENGRVVTFEPNPQNYTAILDHIALNGIANVQVLQLGLGSERGTLKFVVSDHKPAMGTANPKRQDKLLGQEEIKVLQIEIDTMDNQIAANDLLEPDFVKIDVEGLELDVLQGMSQTIGSCRPEMLIELHGESEREIAEFLLSHGYNIYQVEDGVDITQQNINMIYGHLYAH